MTIDVFGREKFDRYYSSPHGVPFKGKLEYSAKCNVFLRKLCEMRKMVLSENLKEQNAKTTNLLYLM